MQSLTQDARLPEEVLSLAWIEGRLYAVGDHGVRMAIMMNGGPVSAFNPGWKPKNLLTALSPLVVLQLENEAGEQASWFLDQDLNFISNALRSVPSQTQIEAADQLSAIVSKGIAALLTGQPAGTGIFPPWLHHVSKALCDELISIATNRDAGPGPENCIFLDAVEDELGMELSAEASSVGIDIGWARSLLGQQVVSHAVSFIEARSVSIDSPSDPSRKITCDFAVSISPLNFAYRFVDQDLGLTFFLMSGTVLNRFMAIYFPASGNIYLRQSQDLADTLSTTSQDSLSMAVHRSLHDYTLPIAEGFARCRSARLALTYHFPHIGHHLWNELTGLNEIVRQTPPGSVPDVIMVNPLGSEIYGPVDRIFPEIRTVHRGCDDTRSMIKFHYENRFIPLAPTSMHVRRDLASRIISMSEADESCRTDRVAIERIDQSGVPVILLGLRVENRTVVDFGACCVSLVDLLKTLCGAAVIVVDGHNAVRSGNVMVTRGSFQEHLASKSPSEVEREIVASMRRRARGTEIEIIDTIGSPVPRSIFWSHHCDFFITPWGAGLAKYRWVGNRPGLVLAGRHHRHAAVDFNIYWHPAYIEDPVWCDVIDEAFVTDVDQVSLVPTDDSNRKNFRVDPEGLRQQIASIITKIRRIPVSEAIQ